MDLIKLQDISYIINKGKFIKREEVNREGTVCAIGFSDISNGDLTTFIPKVKLENEYMDLKMYGIENNDIILPVITRENLIIKQLNLKNPSNNNIIFSSRAIYIRSDPNKYIPVFLYHLLSTYEYKRRLLDEVYTRGHNNVAYQISLERLRNFEIPKFSIEEQIKILTKEKKLIEKMIIIQEQLEKLYKKI